MMLTCSLPATMGSRVIFLILWTSALLSSGLPEHPPPMHPVDPAVPAVSMVQVRANAVDERTRQARKAEARKAEALRPWELHRYVTCSHHKAGVDLSKDLTAQVFKGLGLNMTQDFGAWNFHCDGVGKLYCFNRQAPVRIETDCCSVQSAQNEQAAYPLQPMRVANSVRDPLDMVASAYCYHHRGMEWFNDVYSPQEVMKMDVQEGVQFMAQTMLDVVANMTSFLEHPHVEVHAVSFEIISASSAGFDAELEKLLDFWPRGCSNLRRATPRKGGLQYLFA